MAEKHPSHSADAVTKPGRAANLYPFLDNTGPNLTGLLTVIYVPNDFDILPMHLVILALIPVWWHLRAWPCGWRFWRALGCGGPQRGAEHSSQVAVPQTIAAVVAPVADARTIEPGPGLIRAVPRVVPSLTLWQTMQPVAWDVYGTSMAGAGLPCGPGPKAIFRAVMRVSAFTPLPTVPGCRIRPDTHRTEASF